jgi:hypothetical protein
MPAAATIVMEVGCLKMVAAAPANGAGDDSATAYSRDIVLPAGH